MWALLSYLHRNKRMSTKGFLQNCRQKNRCIAVGEKNICFFWGNKTFCRRQRSDSLKHAPLSSRFWGINPGECAAKSHHQCLNRLICAEKYTLQVRKTLNSLMFFCILWVLTHLLCLQQKHIHIYAHGHTYLSCLKCIQGGDSPWFVMLDFSTCTLFPYSITFLLKIKSWPLTLGPQRGSGRLICLVCPWKCLQICSWINKFLWFTGWKSLARN